MFELSGKDKGMLQALLNRLERAVDRDSKIADRSKRSRRSKIPLVPPGDERIGQAVTMVIERLHTIIAV